MKITFDPSKAASNLHKHGVRFSDVEPVLYDPAALTQEDEDSEGEQRFLTIGHDVNGRVVVVVVFTYRDHEIRLISARLATARERKPYET